MRPFSEKRLPRLRGCWVLLLAPMLLGPRVLAHTTLIHAVGIDPDTLEQNHDDFYNGAQSFLSYCKAAGLKIGTDCKLYINLSVPRSSKVAPKLQPSQTAGPVSPERILGDFKSALLAAHPGDQVVLSLDDHGAPGPVHSSCVFGLGPSGFERICMSDVEAVIEKYKKPGVRVFISADACFSGAFSELSNREVCTLVAADRYHTNGDADLWPTVLALKTQGHPLSLSAVRSEILLGLDVDSAGGGFGSQVIKTRVCAAEKNPIPINDRNRIAHVAREERIFARSEMEFVESQPAPCSVVGLPYDDAKLYNLAGNIAEIAEQADKNLTPLLRSIDRNCLAPASVNGPFCESLKDYERRIGALMQNGGLMAGREAFERRIDELGHEDEELLRRERRSTPTNAIKLEAKRYQLLKKYQSLKRRFAGRLKEYLKSADFRGLAGDFARIHDTSCFDSKKENGDFEDYLIAHLSLSALRGDRVPESNEALKAAQECESSFQLP